MIKRFAFKRLDYSLSSNNGITCWVSFTALMSTRAKLFMLSDHRQYSTVTSYSHCSLSSGTTPRHVQTQEICRKLGKITSKWDGEYCFIYLLGPTLSTICPCQCFSQGKPFTIHGHGETEIPTDQLHSLHTLQWTV